MRNKITVLFIISLIFLFVNVSAVEIGYWGYGFSAKLWRVNQYSSIENQKDLYSETLIEAYIANKSIVKKYNATMWIYIDGTERNKRFELQDIEIKVCDGFLDHWNGDYKRIDVDCNKTIPYTKNLTYDRNRIEIEFNLSEVSENYFYIKLTYRIKNFVLENGNYKIGWLTTNVEPGVEVTRTLMLPSKNSVIESWNNFDIINGDEYTGWVFRTKGTNENGTAMVWYRDYEREKSERDQRDWLIIVLSLALSIIIQLYYSQKMTKRTINLWMFSEVFLAITGIILLFGKGGNHPFLLVVSFFLFLVTSAFAYLSSIKDAERSSWKRQLRDIIKFGKDNFWKVIIISLIILFIILIAYSFLK